VEIIKSEVNSEPPEQPPIIPAEPVVFAPETKPIGNYSNLEFSRQKYFFDWSNDL
jgi:hypothetical protein